MNEPCVTMTSHGTHGISTRPLLKAFEMKILKSSPAANAFAIMGYVQKLLRETGRASEIDSVAERMKAGNYDNLCQVAYEVSNGSIEIVDDDDDDEDNAQ